MKRMIALMILLISLVGCDDSESTKDFRKTHVQELSVLFPDCAVNINGQMFCEVNETKERITTCEVNDSWNFVNCSIYKNSGVE